MQSELVASQRWASLHAHDYLSLLDGLSSPLDNFSQAIAGNLSALAITNHGNMSSVIKLQKSRKQYIEKCKTQINKSGDNQQKELLAKRIEDAGKLKLIFGNEMYLAQEEKINTHLVVLAKNLSGYKKLIKATSESTRRENFYRKPRLTFDQLTSYAGDLVVIDGHPGSALYSQIWTDVKDSFQAKTYEEARGLVRKDWKKRILTHIGMFKDAFSDNYKLESQLIDAKRLPAAQVAVNIYRWAAKETSTQIVATADSHYPTPERSQDHQILICNSIKKTLPQVRRELASDEDDVGLSGFFLSDRYYLPTSLEMISLHLEEEIRASIEIAESCEEYSLSKKPIIPKFDCPDNISSDEYLTRLCREGWKEKLSFSSKEEKQLYGDRVKEELSVLINAGLSDYFLLVRDIIQWVKDNGGLVGEGRGSVGGCLTAYLIGITALDSIKYNLTFSRFYNDGRNTPGNIALPDVDIDIQPEYRERTMQFLKNKHGEKRVAQISTYGRMQGRSCLSDILRVHESMSFADIKRCTQYIPDESSIADDLNDMREEHGEASIVLWSLQNNSKELSEWATLMPNGDIVGEYANEFKQAIRLEGTFRTHGKHAGGILVYPEDIEDNMPVIYDKSGGSCIAFDLKDCEYNGGTKLDLLGTDILTKINNAQITICNEFLKDLYV